MTDVGRPEIQITPEIIANVERLASRGLTHLQIAGVLGWGVSTLQDKKAKYKEFSEAIGRGKAKGLAEVSNALYESAMSGNYQSQQFYLKNRDNENWNDRRNVELSGEINLTAEQWLENLE